MKTPECRESLKLVSGLARMCERCIVEQLECTIEFIDKQCLNCKSKGVECSSLVVFHNIMDMGSCQVAAVKEVEKITEKSTADDFRNPELLSYAFGGLHQAKSPTNCLRNYSLTLKGENYGVECLIFASSQEKENFISSQEKEKPSRR